MPSTLWLRHHVSLPCPSCGTRAETTNSTLLSRDNQSGRVESLETPKRLQRWCLTILGIPAFPAILPPLAASMRIKMRGEVVGTIHRIASRLEPVPKTWEFGISPFAATNPAPHETLLGRRVVKCTSTEATNSLEPNQTGKQCRQG